MNVTSQEFHQVAFSLKELNKVNSKHILENWQREIVAQTLYFRGPLVGVTRRSSWNNVKNLGGEPSMCLTLSCALVSPNNRGINFWWGMNVEVSRGKAWKHPGDRAVHGRVLRLTLIHPELSCMKSLGLPRQKDDDTAFFASGVLKKKKKVSRCLLCSLLYYLWWWFRPEGVQENHLFEQETGTLEGCAV